MTAENENGHRAKIEWLISGKGPPGFGRVHQETGPDAQHRYNTHVMVDSEGNIVASYRKIHLFDLDLPDGASPQSESECVLMKLRQFRAEMLQSVIKTMLSLGFANKTA